MLTTPYCLPHTHPTCRVGVGLAPPGLWGHILWCAHLSVGGVRMGGGVSGGQAFGAPYYGMPICVQLELGVAVRVGDYPGSLGPQRGSLLLCTTTRWRREKAQRFQLTRTRVKTWSST